jgi:hypothetical protein
MIQGVESPSSEKHSIGSMEKVPTKTAAGEIV